MMVFINFPCGPVWNGAVMCVRWIESLFSLFSFTILFLTSLFLPIDSIDAYVFQNYDDGYALGKVASALTIGSPQVLPDVTWILGLLFIFQVSIPSLLDSYKIALKVCDGAIICLHMPSLSKLIYLFFYEKHGRISLACQNAAAYCFRKFLSGTDSLPSLTDEIAFFFRTIVSLFIPIFLSANLCFIASSNFLT